MTPAVDALAERARRVAYNERCRQAREIPLQPRPLLRPEPTDDYARNR